MSEILLTLPYATLHKGEKVQVWIRALGEVETLELVRKADTLGTLARAAETPHAAQKLFHPLSLKTIQAALVRPKFSRREILALGEDLNLLAGAIFTYSYTRDAQFTQQWLALAFQKRTGAPPWFGNPTGSMNN